MCFSATVSYSAAAVLVTTGVYAVQQARRLPDPHWMLWALLPVFFGIQQAFEDGYGWRSMRWMPMQRCLALGFHFFSHFLWLWWLPLCSYLVEPGQGSTTAKLRRRVIAGCALSALSQARWSML